MTQFYITEAENEYVINRNAAVMKCKIPSFVADFVHVEAWINAEDGTELTRSNDSSAYGYLFFILYMYLNMKKKQLISIQAEHKTLFIIIRLVFL